MKIDLSATNTRCAKCHRQLPLARHHKGCEAMWLRWFSHRRRTQRYKDYEARYNRFEERDIIRLCKNCHRTIHNLYFVIIGHWALESGESLHDWSWADAEKLMAHLRKVCDEWLGKVVV
jgi:hypothetical protein